MCEIAVQYVGDESLKLWLKDVLDNNRLLFGLGDVLELIKEKTIRPTLGGIGAEDVFRVCNYTWTDILIWCKDLERPGIETI